MRSFLAPAALVVALVTGACQRSDPPPPPVDFRPAGDVKQLMNSILDPSADVIWESVGTIVTEAGTEEIVPSNDEEWANVRNHGVMLAEAGNLLMIGSRARDQGEWTRYSHALTEAGQVVMKAAEAKNRDALFEAGGQLYTVCLACHQHYVPEMSPNMPR